MSFNFLDYGAADHIISRSLWNIGVDQSTDAVIMRGACGYRHLVAVKSRDTNETVRAFSEMCGSDTPHIFVSDCSSEIHDAAVE